MKNSISRIGAGVLAGSLALTPMQGDALAPVLLLLVRQIVKDAAQSMLKDMVLSSLNGMGCKGMAIASALEALDLRKGGGGGVGGMMGLLGGGMPKMPAGGMPGLPAGMAMPQLPAGMGMPGGMAMPQLPGGMGIPGMPAGMMPGMPGASLLGAAASEAEMMARMRAMMPGGGQLPAGTGIDAEQMASVMQAMSRPLSPPETLAVIDEMTEIGFLPKAMQTELKQCMLLLPAAAPALGMGMGMMKPMLPQLRQARDELHALSPAEQDELAAALASDLKAVAPADRKSLLEFIDGGFFPKRLAESLRAQLGAA